VALGDGTEGEETVETMKAVAAGTIDEETLSCWVAERMKKTHG